MTVEPARHYDDAGSLGEMETISTIPALRRYIVGELEAGRSMRAAIAGLRRTGRKVRTEDFAAIWRDEKRKREQASA